MWIFFNIICVNMSVFCIVLSFKIWWFFRETRETRCYQLKIVSTLSGKARSRFSPFAIFKKIFFLKYFFIWITFVLLDILQSRVHVLTWNVRMEGSATVTHYQGNVYACSAFLDTTVKFVSFLKDKRDKSNL